VVEVVVDVVVVEVVVAVVVVEVVVTVVVVVCWVVVQPDTSIIANKKMADDATITLILEPLKSIINYDYI